MSSDDLIIAFFPCIHFCDAKTLYFRGQSINQKNKTLSDMMIENIQLSEERQRFYVILMKLVAVCSALNLRLIIENPYNSSGMTYLENNFIKPTIVDRNRTLRGDYYIKPTAFWFINCTNTDGFSYQNDKKIKTIMNSKKSARAGLCSEERSLISPDYARNFICDFVIGKEQKQLIQGSLF